MIGNASGHESRQRFIVLTAFGVLAAALLLFARVALDIALALALCAGVFLVQRTAGDWLSDVLGARFGTLIFASVAGVLVWLLLMTSGGQTAVERFFAAADHRGFHTVFLERQIIPPSSVRRLPSPPPAGGAPQSVETSEAPTSAPTETQGTGGRSDASGTRADAMRNGAKGTTVPTQVYLQLTTTRARVGERVIATAIVRAGGETVDRGSVVFTANGLSRAVAVKDGIATADIVEMASGRCEVRAQYRGTSRFAPASSSLAVLIVE
jgi:hypothetical protein